MTEHISNFELCMAMATELKTSKSFNALAQTSYGENWTVEVGVDCLRQDWKKVAPFAIVLPQSVSGTNNGLITYGAGILLGVVDKRVNTQDVQFLEGLHFLSSLAVPELFSLVFKAIDAIPHMNFTEFESEYEQESAPLLYCNIALTFTKHSPIGGRRR